MSFEFQACYRTLQSENRYFVLETQDHFSPSFSRFAARCLCLLLPESSGRRIRNDENSDGDAHYISYRRCAWTPCAIPPRKSKSNFRWRILYHGVPHSEYTCILSMLFVLGSFTLVCTKLITCSRRPPESRPFGRHATPTANMYHVSFLLWTPQFLQSSSATNSVNVGERP
jgi:hypothetical protein